MKSIILAIALLTTFSIVEAQTAGKSHTVQRGETIESIAMKYNTTVQELQSANPVVVNLFYVGMNLNIPNSTSMVERNTSQEPTNFSVYTSKSDIYFQKAGQAFERGNYSRAAKLFKKSYKETSSVIDLYNAGISQYNNGEFKHAYKTMKEVLYYNNHDLSEDEKETAREVKENAYDAWWQKRREVGSAIAAMLQPSTSYGYNPYGGMGYMAPPNPANYVNNTYWNYSTPYYSGNVGATWAQFNSSSSSSSSNSSSSSSSANNVSSSSGSSSLSTPTNIDFVYSDYFKYGSNNKLEGYESPEGDGWLEFIVRMEMSQSQVTIKLQTVDRMDSDKRKTLETHYIDPSNSSIEITSEMLRITYKENGEYKSITFEPEYKSLTINDSWSDSGECLKARHFSPPSSPMDIGMIEGFNENKNFEHTTAGETAYSDKYNKLKKTLLEYNWKKLIN